MAAGTLFLGAPQIGYIAGSEVTSLGLGLVALCFPLHLLAAALAFLGRDAVAGLASAILAGVWLGLTSPVVALLSLYVGLGLALEDSKRRVVLPLGRRDAGREALEGARSKESEGPSAMRGCDITSRCWSHVGPLGRDFTRNEMALDVTGRLREFIAAFGQERASPACSKGTREP